MQGRKGSLKHVYRKKVELHGRKVDLQGRKGSLKHVYTEKVELQGRKGCSLKNVYRK